MDAFGGTGRRPRRAIPRTMCCRSASGCSGETLMSRSFMARTRFQSVLDAFEEDRLFITSGSPKRNDVNSIGYLGVDKRNRDSAKEPERYEALLTIIETVVLESEGWTSNTRGA